MMKGHNQGAVPGEEFNEVGRDLPEGLELLKILEKAGVDAFHVDKGCYDSWYWAHPPVYMKHGNMIDMAPEAKKVVSVPVIGVGRLDDPELAIQVIEKGAADMVAIGRGLLADPFWPNKVKERRYADIRPCLGCHYGCMYRLREKKPLSCSINPACGREKSYGIVRVRDKKRVLIIGGGIAGMEAARVATLRGHEVTLYEKTDRLGGHLVLMEALSYKYGHDRLLRYYSNQIKKLNIDVKYNEEVNKQVISRESHDVILVATGSVCQIPEDIDGIKDNGVITSVELLAGRHKVGDTVIIIGGGLIGCELALWLKYKGKDVTILEMLPALLSDGVQAANRQMLLDMLVFNQVQIRLNAEVRKIINRGVIYQDKKGEERELAGDTVVCATGLDPVDDVYRSLATEYPNVYALGDCAGGKNIHDAIWSAYGVAREF
jgi:2-enoate reductase